MEQELLKSQAMYDLQAEFARQRYRSDGVSNLDSYMEAKLDAYIESLRARSYFDDSGELTT